MWIHPALDKAMAAHPDLTAAERLFGFSINEADYERFLKEAEVAVPHLDARMKHLWAVYNAQRHCQSVSMQSKRKRGPTIAESHHAILILQILILAVLVLFFAMRGHAQEPAGALKRSKGQEAAALPTTIIPLEDAAKVKVLKLLHDQDQAIIKRRDRQLEIEELDRHIADLQNQINEAAQELAKQSRIDVEHMVLDLDKLASMTKEQPK